MLNKKLLTIVLTSAIILCIPLITMFFTDEVNWDIFDFIIAGILLIGTGLTCDFVVSKTNNIIYRFFICITIFVVLIIIWVELAVGIFSNWFCN